MQLEVQCQRLFESDQLGKVAAPKNLQRVIAGHPRIVSEKDDGFSDVGRAMPASAPHGRLAAIPISAAVEDLMGVPTLPLPPTAGSWRRCHALSGESNEVAPSGRDDRSGLPANVTPEHPDHRGQRHLAVTNRWLGALEISDGQVHQIAAFRRR